MSGKASKIPYAYICAVLICMLAFIVLHSLTADNEFYTGPGSVDPSLAHIADNNQYAYLADALLNGSLSLEITPPNGSLTWRTPTIAASV